METPKAARQAPRSGRSRTSTVARNCFPREPTATEIAHLVQNYLLEQNFSGTLSAFRKEAASALSSTGRETIQSLRSVLRGSVGVSLECMDLTVKLRESQACVSELQRKLEEAEGNLVTIRGLLEGASKVGRSPQQTDQLAFKRKRIMGPKAFNLPRSDSATSSFDGICNEGGLALADIDAVDLGSPSGSLDGARWEDFLPSASSLVVLGAPEVNLNTESSGPPGTPLATDSGVLLRTRLNSPPPEPGPIEDILNLPPCEDIFVMYDSMVINTDESLREFWNFSEPGASVE